MSAESNEASSHGKSFEIYVNGTPEIWTDQKITYGQVVQLAYPESGADFLFTVSFANEHGKEGTLAPGQETPVHDGTRFNVVKTNRS
jgi:hypothetical protein